MIGLCPVDPGRVTTMGEDPPPLRPALSLYVSGRARRRHCVVRGGRASQHSTSRT